MTAYLLDTNVISETRRQRPNLRVNAWLSSVADESCHISVVSIAELRRGGAMLPEGDARHAITGWLETIERESFAGRILPVTESILVRWLHVLSDRRAGRQPAVCADLLIAATAIEHDLVSNDRRDFVGAGATMFNPWTGTTTSPP